MNLPSTRRAAVFVLVSSMTVACGSPQPPPSSSAPPSGDAAFTAVAQQYLEDMYRRNPSRATSLGIHMKSARRAAHHRRARSEENQASFADTARAIDPKRSARQPLDAMEADHPPPDKLLETTQPGLDAIGDVDEGFHADDPRYRLAAIQDALLRDARFIAGIRISPEFIDKHPDAAGAHGHRPVECGVGIIVVGQQLESITLEPTAVTVGCLEEQ
jgi:hypothetical protein